MIDLLSLWITSTASVASPCEDALSRRRKHKEELRRLILDAAREIFVSVGHRGNRRHLPNQPLDLQQAPMATRTTISQNRWDDALRKLGKEVPMIRLRTNRITNTGASQSARGMLLAPLENISSTAAIASQIHERDSARAGRSSRRGTSFSCPNDGHTRSVNYHSGEFAERKDQIAR
jgi:hypothetical protein